MMMMMMVPDDLVIEILFRLPTRSLLRFQCVCNDWISLIASISLQRKAPLSMSGLFVYLISEDSTTEGLYASIAPDPDSQEDDCKVFASSQSMLSKLPFHSELYLIHSCNGLLLFARRQSRCLYVWNPATVEFVALPVPPRMDFKDCFLAFDPRESLHYKVLRFCMNLEDTSKDFVEIYSSMTESWTEISAPREYPFYLYRWDPMSAFYKGALHMFMPWGRLLRFDVEKGCFHNIELPGKQNDFDVRHVSCIGEARGDLYYAVNFPLRFELQIYKLDYWNADKWLLTHRMSTEFLDHHPLTSGLDGHKPSLDIEPITFHPESEVVYFILPRVLFSYNLSNGRLEEVCKLTDDIAKKWDQMVVFPVFHCLKLIDPDGSKSNCS